jgi:pimeloyl-ACP methyl ester carboxylesterase
MAHRFHLVERFNIRPRLGSIRVRTLLLTGDRDLLAPPASVRQLRDGIADAREVVLEGCGHFAAVAQPERVAHEVKRFLADR